jgi:membrane-bound lytic murein transglycosylase D
MKNIFLLSIVCVFLFSCVQNPKKIESSEYTEKGDLQNFRVGDESGNLNQTKTQELETIPIEINENVEKWIKYFQGRGRPHMERYLARSTRYEALMKKVLRDNKLPEDLFYIALIESGFSSSARSTASAVGYWQFIRGTGKHYKLEINKMIDERRDPILATQAAAEYFKDLFKLFNSWYLSMAAYNVGEGRVLKVVKKYKTNDFWELSRNKRALPQETDNYVPKYIAAKLIAKNPDKYGFEGIDYMTPIEFDYLSFDQPVNLKTMSEKMNINYEDFKDLNPKYKGEVAPLDEGKLNLRIPPGTLQAGLEAAKISIASVVDFIPDQNDFDTHKVKRGETLSTIARKYRTNIAYLREINDLSRKKTLRIGQKLLVPDRTSNAKNKKSKTESEQIVKGAFYIVQPGDSLASIAEKYKISVLDLKRSNKLSRKSKIKSGRRLALPESASVTK